MDNLEFKIHELPKTKPSDVIEIRFKKEGFNAELLRSMEQTFRKAGHEGVLMVLPPDDEVQITKATAEEWIKKLQERISD